MSKYFWLVLVIVIAIGGLFFLNQNKPTLVKEESVKTTTENSPIKEFIVTAKSWAFDPAVITVKQGDKVRLKINSVDVTHGFALPDFDVKVDLVPNKEETVEFTADKKGEFTFFCSVMCGEGHRDMKGKLIVE